MSLLHRILRIREFINNNEDILLLSRLIVVKNNLPTLLLMEDEERKISHLVSYNGSKRTEIDYRGPRYDIKQFSPFNCPSRMLLGYIEYSRFFPYTNRIIVRDYNDYDRSVTLYDDERIELLLLRHNDLQHKSVVDRYSGYRFAKDNQQRLLSTMDYFLFDNKEIALITVHGDGDVSVIGKGLMGGDTFDNVTLIHTDSDNMRIGVKIAASQYHSDNRYYDSLFSKHRKLLSFWKRT